MTTKTAVRTKSKPLDALATNMREMLNVQGIRFVHRRLARGLEIVLQRDDHKWRLALGRTDVAPSDSEIEICRDAFGVPEGTEVSNVSKKRWNPKTGTATLMYVVDMTWTEA